MYGLLPASDVAVLRQDWHLKEVRPAAPSCLLPLSQSSDLPYMAAPTSPGSLCIQISTSRRKWTGRTTESFTPTDIIPRYESKPRQIPTCFRFAETAEGDDSNLNHETATKISRCGHLPNPHTLDRKFEIRLTGSWHTALTRARKTYGGGSTGEDIISYPSTQWPLQNRCCQQSSRRTNPYHHRPHRETL